MTLTKFVIISSDVDPECIISNDEDVCMIDKNQINQLLDYYDDDNVIYEVTIKKIQIGGC